MKHLSRISVSAPAPAFNLGATLAAWLNNLFAAIKSGPNLGPDGNVRDPIAVDDDWIPL